VALCFLINVCEFEQYDFITAHSVKHAYNLVATGSSPKMDWMAVHSSTLYYSSEILATRER